MKIVTFANLKGGSGKTSNVFNIAGVLSKDSRVLLIDIDPQCNLSSDCGIDIANRNIFTVRDIFSNNPKSQPEAADLVVKSPIEALPNLDILPSSILLFRVEKQLVVSADSERILAKYFDRNAAFFSQYDYIIFDTNPSMSKFNINALFISDSIVITTDVSYNSILGAELFCELWDECREEMGKEKDNIAALIIGNYDKRTRLGRELIEYVNTNDFSRDIVCKTIVPASVKVKDSELSHKPVNVLFPNDGITNVFTQLVAELKKGGVF